MPPTTRTRVKRAAPAPAAPAPVPAGASATAASGRPTRTRGGKHAPALPLALDPAVAPAAGPAVDPAAGPAVDPAAGPALACGPALAIAAVPAGDVETAAPKRARRGRATEAASAVQAAAPPVDEDERTSRNGKVDTGGQKKKTTNEKKKKKQNKKHEVERVVEEEDQAEAEAEAAAEVDVEVEEKVQQGQKQGVRAKKSIIPGHHLQVPAFGGSSVEGSTRPLCVTAALDNLHHGVREDQRHHIKLPAEFRLGHVDVYVVHDGRRMGMDIRDRTAGKAFRTLPEFVAHLRDTGYAAALPFYVEDYIDGARKQIGFLYRKQQTVNPNLRNEFACTPACIYRFLEDVWGKRVSSFDPAPRNPTVDSLTVPWSCAEGECVYVNPPFNHMAEWGAKILQELEAGRVTDVVLMMPGRISPDWFHSIVLRYATRLVIGNNSLRFKGYKHNFPTGVILAEFLAPVKENSAGVVVTSARFHDWDP